MSFTEKIKKEVRRRAHFCCCICKDFGVEIHHIIPQEEKGKNTIDNAAPLCPSCHEKYGANPQKRKIIREARDHWYEICSQRYSINNEDITTLMENLNMLKDSVCSELKEEILKEIKEEIPNINLRFTLDNIKGLSVDELISNIVLLEKNLSISNDESLQVTYSFLFETAGDMNIEEDAEYNDIRQKFLNTYGSIVAKNLTISYMHNLKVDWLKGVADFTLQDLLSINFATMLFMLWHKDLNYYEVKVDIAIDNKGVFYAHLIE